MVQFGMGASEYVRVVGVDCDNQAVSYPTTSFSLTLRTHIEMYDWGQKNLFSREIGMNKIGTWYEDI